MVMMLDAFCTHNGWAHYREILTEVSALVDSGAMRTLLDEHRFTFDHVGEAHDYAALGQHLGKIALTHPMNHS